MRRALAALALAAALAALQAHPAWGEAVRHPMEGGMVLEVGAPASVPAGAEFPVSVLVRNDGWEDKERVEVSFGAGGAVAPVGRAGLLVDRMTAGSSYGETAAFLAAPGAPPGTHYLNLAYSHVLLENNAEPREPYRADVAVPIEVRARTGVSVHAAAPESIFAGAEFALTAVVRSEDSDLRDVTVEMSAPGGVGFRGQAVHSFSTVRMGEPAEAVSRLFVHDSEVAAERRVPLTVSVSYTDDSGAESHDTRTVSPVLRPRGHMEITSDGGIWIGGFFVAPYVSVGTLVGIPAGALLSLLLRRRARGRDA